MLTRLDDFGSSCAANLAIAEVAAAGSFVKNVSCMAVGPHIEAGAEFLKNQKQLCLGMHATLNAEWDFIKWPPISPIEDIPTLVTKAGMFYSNPTCFTKNLAEISQILLEYERQLDFLTNLGLDIRYVDSHMLPETHVAGLSEAMSDWAKRKGLIDHSHFYRFPAQPEPQASICLEERCQHVLAWLDSLQDGGYFFVMHPAKMSRELLLYGNKQFPAEIVASARDVEYQLLRNLPLEQVCCRIGIHPIGYDEAVYHPEWFARAKDE